MVLLFIHFHYKFRMTWTSPLSLQIGMRPLTMSRMGPMSSSTLNKAGAPVRTTRTPIPRRSRWKSLRHLVLGERLTSATKPLLGPRGVSTTNFVLLAPDTTRLWATKHFTLHWKRDEKATTCLDWAEPVCPSTLWTSVNMVTVQTVRWMEIGLRCSQRRERGQRKGKTPTCALKEARVLERRKT